MVRLAASIESNVRAIALLTLRESQIRFHDSKLSLALVFIEPALQIAVIFSILWVINRQPAFGNSLLLFLGTGFGPFFLFTNASSGLSGALRAAKGIGGFSMFVPLDLAFARATFEFLIHLAVYAIGFASLYWAGISEAIPVRPDIVLQALLAVLALSMAVGLLNAVTSVIFPAWRVIYGVLSRSLLFVSGVFYVPDMMPPFARDLLSWNPLLHVIEWTRLGFYSTYPEMILDRTYLWFTIGTMFALALMLERTLRIKFGLPQ